MGREDLYADFSLRARVASARSEVVGRVCDPPWIVRAAVGRAGDPALLGSIGDLGLDELGELDEGLLPAEVAHLKRNGLG